MPYFIYRVSPFKVLSFCSQHEEYGIAKTTIRMMRSEQAQHDTDTIKMIFAEDADEAERLLMTKREPQPSEDG